MATKRGRVAEHGSFCCDRPLIIKKKTSTKNPNIITRATTGVFARLQYTEGARPFETVAMVTYSPVAATECSLRENIRMNE